MAQIPMNVSFIDIGKREKFGRVPNSLSEEEALLSRYEIGDFSYGTAYDCLIIFYDQDNEEIDVVLKLGEFETGIENVTNNGNMDVEISMVQ